MSNADKPVQCDSHGRTPSTFVCRHLEQGCGCGFHDGGTEGDPWPDAWCDKCQAILDRDGEWTDENLPSSELALLCTGCYEAVRERNRQVPAPLRPGQLSVSEEEYGQLAHHAHEWCGVRQAEAEARWSIGRWRRWFYDGELRTIRFFDEEHGPGVVADVELTGSFSTRTNTWMWAWGNEQYSESRRRPSRPVSVFGEVRGIKKLAEAHWPADEIDGWEVTQIAARLLGAEAVYRAPMDHLHVFMLLRNLRAERSSGHQVN